MNSNVLLVAILGAAFLYACVGLGKSAATVDDAAWSEFTTNGGAHCVILYNKDGWGARRSAISCYAVDGQ